MDTGVQKIFIVGNKVANSDEAEPIKRFVADNKFLLLGLIPYDKQILKADVKGETPLEYVKGSSGVATIRKIGEELLEHKM